MTINRITDPAALEPIYLIRSGADATEAVVFDLTWLKVTFGAGTAELVYKRARDKAPAKVEAVQSGTTLTWTISADDVAYNGPGKAAIRWTVDEALAKIIEFPVHVGQAEGTGFLDATPSEGSVNPVSSGGVYDFVNEHGGGGGGDVFVVKAFDAEGSGEYSLLTDAADIAAAIQARKALFVAVGGTDEGAEWWTGPYPAEGEVEADESGNPTAFQIDVATTTSASNVNGKLSLTFANIMIQHNFTDPTEDSITMDFPTYKVTLA